MRKGNRTVSFKSLKQSLTNYSNDMKIKKMMVALLATLVFVSCSKESDETIKHPAGEKASLSINVTSDSGVDSRAIGTIATDKIDNYTVFVTNALGEIQWTAYSSDASPITAMEVEAHATHVFIVANGGNLTQEITTKAGLDTYLLDMMSAKGNQFTTRIATGNTGSALNFTENSSGDLVANTTINLTFIAARVTVKIVNGMTGYDPAKTDGSLVLNQVAILNATQESKLFGQSLMASPVKYLAGYDASSTSSLWPAGTTIAANLYANPIAANDFTTTYHYYVFENDASVAADHPTIVTLVATFDGKTIYYPVHLAPYERFSPGSSAVSSVQRGKSYDITVTLTVDPTIEGGDGGGTIDPTLPDGEAEINIDVQLNDWVPVVLNKEF